MLADVMSLEALVIHRHMSEEVVPFIHWFSFIRNNTSPFRDGNEKAPSLPTITLVTNFQCVNVWKDKSLQLNESKYLLTLSFLFVSLKCPL